MFYIVLVFLFSNAKLTTMAEYDLIDSEVVKPFFLGEANVTLEIELGLNQTVICEAFIGYRNTEIFFDMYWLQVKNDSNIVGSCDDNIYTVCGTQMLIKNKTSGLFSIIELHLINISEDDTNYHYNCKMDNSFGSYIKTYILKIREKTPDISHKVFTASIAVSITCSICIILLVVSCILLRIEIILLYRSITGKDETITDGKEYDAYVSYTNHSFTEAEERKFALQTLPDVLENYFGYKLCIFERDIVPGGSTVDDINTYIDKCRRLIILLSKSYISDKAIYELENGLHKAMVERKIKVILIEFTPFKEMKIMPESVKLLKASSRIKWKRDQSFTVKSRFWKKIQYLMPAKPFKPNRLQEKYCSAMNFKRGLSTNLLNGEIHTITVSQ